MLELGRYKVLPLYVAFSQDIDETTLTLSHPDLRIVKEVARVCCLILDRFNFNHQSINQSM
jgi:hypothetical protein